MRRVLFVVCVLTAACGASPRGNPAWPKMADKEADGGESIAPHPGATSIVAATDTDDDDDDIKVVAAPTAATPAAAAAAAPAVTPTVTAPEDTITIEEITIEIDD
ncbi:MAG: hypothetical protein IPQ07_39675 [Myxococcales bacterium]|nr:hypothetical protein [Myxococcales bacterium]